MSLAHTIDAIVIDAIERRIFPGAVVLIANANAIRHYAAYGSTMYDVPESRSVERDTIYDIASLTKVFTATAALQLLDQGLLDLDAPVAAYLPNFQAREVRLLHLFTHTSGIDLRLSTLCHGGRAAILAAVYNAIPIHPPGTNVAYTNVNTLLLGEIVERLSGESLDRALQNLLITPLGLRETMFCPPETLAPRIAPTEIDERWRGCLVHGQVHDESAAALGGVAGHAGLFSTAADLYAFCRAWLEVLADCGLQTCPDASRRIADGRLQAGSFLRTETARLAITNQTASRGIGCGLGWMIDRPNFMGLAPPGSFGHTGFTGPAVVVVPERQMIVVVLNNRTYPQRTLPAHHATIAAIVTAALRQDA